MKKRVLRVVFLGLALALILTLVTSTSAMAQSVTMSLLKRRGAALNTAPFLSNPVASIQSLKYDPIAWVCGI